MEDRHGRKHLDEGCVAADPHATVISGREETLRAGRGPRACRFLERSYITVLCDPKSPKPVKHAASASARQLEEAPADVAAEDVVAAKDAAEEDAAAEEA